METLDECIGNVRIVLKMQICLLIFFLLPADLCRRLYDYGVDNAVN